MMLIDKTSLLLLISLVAILPLGRGGREPLMAVTLVLLMLLGIFIVWRLPKVQPLGRDWLTTGWLGLLAWSAMSLVWSINRFQTTVWILEIATATAAFLIAYQLQKQRDNWLKGYWLITIGFSLYGYWVYVTDTYERLTSTFYWANPYAAFIAPAVILAWWHWSKYKNRFALAAGVIGLTAIFLTYSRSTYLLLGLAAVAITIKFFRAGWHFWFRSVMLVLAAIVVMQCVNYSRVWNQRVKQSEPKVEVLSAKDRFTEAVKGESDSGNDRVLYLQTATNIWRDFFLLGTGGGTFRTSFVRYQPRVVTYSVHPHNLYVQVFSELGLAGGLLLAAALYGVLQSLWRSRGRDNTWVWMLAVSAAVIHLGLDLDTAYPVFWPLVGALVGLTYRPGERAKNRSYPVWAAGTMVVLVVVAVGRYQSRDLVEWGKFRQELGDYGGAAQYYQKAQRSLIYDPDAAGAEGIMYYSLALGGTNRDVNLSLAAETATRAISQDPWDAQHVFLRGRAQMQKGDLAAAERDFLAALRLAPLDNPDYYRDLAYLYLRQGRLDEALKVCDRATAFYSDIALSYRQQDTSMSLKVSEIYRAKAEIYLSKGSLADTKAALEHSLRIFPDNQGSKDMLERL